ncbi:MAG: hypothetical protein DHS20C16_05030 [Phycisphaerae bacterium]|nr:MAG: hypothetical protein DHS20C16_05030 [Phycisphaerae bacterium]
MVPFESTKCPEPALLRQYEAGELADSQADALTYHASICATCGKAIENLRTSDLTCRLIRSAVRGRSAESLGNSDTGAGAEVEASSASNWQIPDYHREKLCGEGAFGTVWAVRDRVGLFRALKTLNLSRLRSAKVRCRESTALEIYCRSVPKHRNLVEIFHVGMHGEALYYTMDLADDDRTGRSVRKALPENYRPMTLQSVMRRQSLGPDTAIEIVIRLLRGLERLHEADLAHRDIKPANVIFVERVPKLADIGMITTETASPSLVGTPEYMPPDSYMDPTADVYAMGRILFELLTNKEAPGFPKLPTDDSIASDRWKIEDVAKVIAVAAASDQEDRYESAHEMLEALEACRELPLLAQLAAPSPTTKSTIHPLTPIGVAIVNAIPWMVGVVLVYKLIRMVLQ